jgi:RHS repeat-associated protein
VEQISFKQGSTVRMTTTKQYDFLNRLTSVASLPAGANAVSFAYDYNPANQRVRRREGDGSYWRYEYDALGQVRSGRKYWADGTPVAGQQFEYAFDDIGNRIGTGAGGNEGGTGLRSASYSANLLNQYSSRTVPGAVDVMGMALATNAVTVNGQSVYRKGEYFRKELSVNNASAPVWQQVDVAAPNETTVTRHEFIPRTPESFTYDADGNLTQDGRWHYTWDGENRLVRMSSANTNPAVGPQQWVEFEYDWQGRRISKKVGAAGSGVATNDLRFVYDGWNLLAILTSDFSLLTSFTWGLDLSGTMQGAGGVGGLLWMTVPSGANAGRYFCAYDGNGNVMALVSAADGSVAARYEYGPFGELIRATGPMAKVNPFRFSTKYQDEETGLVYYGYRYEKDGRWPNRDPIEELGFRTQNRRQAASRVHNNPYEFVRNSPIVLVDVLGLTEVTSTQPFCGATKNADGIYVLHVDDGQDGTVELHRITMAEVEVLPICPTNGSGF